MGTATPKYQILLDWVMENAENGKMKPGCKIPSENELAEMFGISRQTVRHAIGLLEQKDVVKRVRGSGTYLEYGGPEGENRYTGPEETGGAGRREPGGKQNGSRSVGERPRRYQNVAVISTYADDYIFPSVIQGIERTLSKNHYTMQIAFTRNRVSREREALINLIEKDCIDGLILEPAKSALPSANMRLYQTLVERQIPILCFHCSNAELDFPCVAMDDRQVGRQAAACLIRAGHEKIGGIFKSDDNQGHLRYQGFEQSLKEAGIRLKGKETVWMDTVSMAEMELWADYLFHRLEGCTAVVCYNDQVAYRLAGLCEKRGIRIPEDLSLVGIDHLEQAFGGQQKITSFQHPKEALGRKAAENMIRMIQDPSFDGNYLFDAPLVELGTVKKLV